ncbi:SARP family transcriptional regulator [Streptomyces griseocarneus]|nr:SARP family transcriptional regulator [Streptomyces griseocarneus]
MTESLCEQGAWGMGGEDSRNTLRFSVLGPVRAWRGGTELALGAPQQRCVLAVLLLRDGLVTAGEIVDALWGERPPQSALGTVRTHAYRLRRVLGHDVLGPDIGGYRIDTRPCHVDAAECERLAAEATRHRADGRTEAALGALDTALALWRGEALHGLPGPYAERQRAYWAEHRLELLEARMEAALDLGHHDRVTGELAELVHEHPLREHFSRLRILALYRAGRQAEALEAYTSARRTVVAELGVEPGPELRELHARILAADPGLALVPAHDRGATRSHRGTAPLQGSGRPDAARGRRPDLRGTPVGAARSGTAPVPRQLPMGAADFVGRRAEVDALRDALLPSGGMPVVAVSGLGGVGKTELAVHLAHSVAPYFPDGQLYADLHGEDGRPALPEEVLGSFLRAFGIAREALPAGLAERSALLRSALGGRRVLFVLDNARDVRQVRPLLPGGPGCAVLVTSRSRLSALPAACSAELGVFTPDEALRLFTGIVGEQRVDAEPAASLDLLAACGHLPLAIRILAARLVNRPQWPLAGILGRLADDRRRLDVLRTGDLAVETTFRFGYDQLEPAQARAFRLLAVPAVPGLSLAAVAAVLDLPRDEAESLAESLVDASMLQSPAPGRYRYHDLLRDFARGIGDEDRTGALDRLVRHYRAATAAALGPAARRVGLTCRQESAVPAPVRTEHEGIAKLVAQWAEETEPGLDLRPAAELLLGATLLYESGQATRELGRAAEALLHAVRQRGEHADEARVRFVLGKLLLEEGSSAAAVTELARARDIGRSHDLPHALQAHIHSALGACHYHAGCHDEAIARFTTAAELRHGLDDPAGAAVETLGTAGALARLGRFGEALRVAASARAVCHDHADTDGEALAENALGRIAQEHGDHTRAAGHYRASIALLRPDDRRRTGRNLRRLAETLRAAGRPSEAVEAAVRAVDILTADGDHRGRGLAMAALAHALAERDAPGDAAAAQRCRTEAHDILALIGDPEADALRDPGAAAPPPGAQDTDASVIRRNLGR